MPKYAYMCKCVFPRPQQWFRGTVVCFGFQYNLQTHTFLFCGDHKLSLDSLSEITTPYFPSRTEYGTAYAKGYALKGSVSSKRIASSLKTIAWNFFCEIHLGSRAHLGFYDTYNMLFTLARMCWNACYAPPRRNVFLHWQKKPSICLQWVQVIERGLNNFTLPSAGSQVMKPKLTLTFIYDADYETKHLL